MGGAGTSSIPGAESNTIRIGDFSTTGGNANEQTATFIARIKGVNIGTGSEVVINASGQLGTVSSSARYKEDIQNLGDVSSAIFDLRPVQFRYKQPAPDGTKPVQFGLIGEEVEKVIPELVTYGKAGEVESVQYHELPALLLNELQKQHRHIQDQDQQIEQLKEQVKSMQGLISTTAPAQQ